MSHRDLHSPNLLESPQSDSPDHLTDWDDADYESGTDSDHAAGRLRLLHDPFRFPRLNSRRDRSLSDDRSRFSDRDEASASAEPEIEESASALNPDEGASVESNVVNEDSNSAPISVSEDSRSSVQEKTDDKVVSTVAEPPSKLLKRSNSESDEEQDGQSCPICLETWGSTGIHRLVALKCGHIFGSKCVEKWLRSQKPSARSCPTCKSKSDLRDIRAIYARKLIAADASEITELMKQVETLKAEKCRTEIELQTTKIAHRACLDEMVRLRAIATASRNPTHTTRKHWRFSLEKNLEMTGARVLAYNCRTYELYVSQKSTNTLFPGYGVRKFDCINYKPGSYTLLHGKTIRDMSYSQTNDMLVTASQDGAARLVPRNGPALTVETGTPLWSCAWNSMRDSEFYLGAVGGVIYSYDWRHLTNPVTRFVNATDMSPVVSLCSTDYGLLSCSLVSCLEWKGSNDTWEHKPLPVSGPYSSMSYDEESSRLVINCRPKGTQRARLHVCKVRGTTTGETSWEVESTIVGSATSVLLTRATWVRVPNAAWVASYNESDTSLMLHGLDGANTLQLPAWDPILDLCSAQMNGSTILSAISENRLRIFKATPVPFDL